MTRSLKWSVRRARLQLAGYTDSVIDGIIQREQLAEYSAKGAAAAPTIESPALPVSRPLIAPAWIERARAEAQRIVKRQAALDLYPSQVVIADEIARILREKGIYGVSGKPLTGSSIKRRALDGITSAKKKRQSTTLKRGK